MKSTKVQTLGELYACAVPLNGWARPAISGLPLVARGESDTG